MSLAFPKPVRERDELREDFVRQMPCLILTQGGATESFIEHGKICSYINNARSCESHHVRKGSGSGVGTKPSARRTVPLCDKAHREYHQLGHETFSSKYNIDLESQLIRINFEFDQAHPDRKPKRERLTLRIPSTKFIRVDCVCGRQHDIPPSKILRVGSKLQFQCAITSKWQPLKVCK